jgi:hypothetical protein
MLKNLGVNVDTPALPVAPNGQPYNPQTSPSASWARAVSSGSEPSLGGPLGKIYSQPKREIFVAGYNGINGKSHALYEDFGSLSNLTVIGQDSVSDSGWAQATDDSLLRKSVAADLNGDGIDEVVIVTLVKATNKMLIHKGEYKNNAFAITQTREYDTPKPVNDLLPPNTNIDYDLPHIGWKLISADLNGDGKQECILTLPDQGGAYMYLLDNDLARTAINIQPYLSGLPTEHRWFPMVTAADYDQDGKDELCLMFGVNSNNVNAPYVVLDDRDAGFAPLHEGTVSNSGAHLKIGNLVAGDFTGDGLPDTAFYGRGNDEYKYLMLLKTTINADFKPVFTWVVSANKSMESGGHIIGQMAAGDVNGDRQADLYATDCVKTPCYL